jgi:hypothetical protein
VLRLTEADRDRFAELLVSIAEVLRIAEDAVLIARMKDVAKEPPAVALGVVSRARSALADLLSWIAGDHHQALSVAQMRIVQLTAEPEIDKGYAREIIDELCGMRDAVSDLGEVYECPVCHGKQVIREGCPQVWVDCPACTPPRNAPGTGDGT